jgi:hypothetical protein
LTPVTNGDFGFSDAIHADPARRKLMSVDPTEARTAEADDEAFAEAVPPFGPRMVGISTEMIVTGPWLPLRADVGSDAAEAPIVVDMTATARSPQMADRAAR